MKILNLAVYRFQPLTGLEAARAEIQSLCETHDLKGTILLADEGVNAFVAGAEAAVDTFERRLGEILGMPDLVGKRSWSDFVPFKRLFVKIKPDLIPYGTDLAPEASPRGTAIEAQELKRWYDEGVDFEILDTRNEFEVQIGTFERARSLNLSTFREFADKVGELPPEAKQKPLVIFCTGGIRCEKASLDLAAKGFTDVRQLEGGILKYFEECGDAHYQGSCFVFDDRLAVNGALEPIEVDRSLGSDQLRKELARRSRYSS